MKRRKFLNTAALSAATLAAFPLHGKEIDPSDIVKLEIKYQSGDIRTIKTLCRIDTKNELEYYKNGGILQYVLRNMI